MFEKRIMRKNVKCVLAFTKAFTVAASVPPGSNLVTDVGYLIYLVSWPRNCTHAGICNSYVDFHLKLYGQIRQ